MYEEISQMSAQTEEELNTIINEVVANAKNYGN
jgi:hypothetical protein